MSDELLNTANDTPEKTPSMADFEDRMDPDTFDAPVWARLQEKKDSREILHVTISGIVKGGVITQVEDIRGFIPMRELDTKYVENPESYLNKEVDARIIEVSRPDKRLILSVRDVIKERERAKRKAAIAAIPVGTVLDAKVESIQPYGAFLRTEDGISGLVHISQISTKRIKTPEDELTVGQEVKAKVIRIKDGKLSLSIRALLEPEAAPEEPAHFNKADLPKVENVTTNLGDLLKDIHID